MSEPPLTSFLSYAKERVETVRELHDFIKSMGVDCWFDKESLVGGDHWNVERRKAQDAADLFIAVVSEETRTRDGVVQRELNDALKAAGDRLPGRMYIVPIRIDLVDLPEALAGSHAIDMFEPDWKARLARTLRKAAGQYGRSTSGALEVAAAIQASGRTLARREEEEDASGSRSLSYFQHADAGPYWDYVNAEILKIALGGLYAFRRMMADWPADRQPSDWEAGVSEFHRRGELVSLTIGESHYFGGTAHPNHSLRTLNIFGPRCGVVGIRDLFDDEPAALQALLAYCDFVLKQPGGHLAEDDINLAQYADTYGWKLFEHFNVNERGLIVNFSAASGLPHVLGVFDGYVPWEAVSAHVPGSIRDFLRTEGMPLG